MKILTSFALLSLIVISCGKYEKPFISFRSPEKRLMDKTWNCTKVVDQNGIEFTITDRIKFEISGSDSIFTRITNYQPLNVIINSYEADTVVGKWTWLYSLKGKFDKERIRVIYPQTNRVLKIKILTNKELEYTDESLNNSTYTYSKE
jgi:hypothetical protein